ncbi:CDP-2,3-bis-(O-geranylgeranyl)-sn-glycerol synthase [Candidatus Bathyarchaeota archaeon]|nr:MAG: CDP-2,3-bis-(O-geranylgeranyl)-sn-glycerol synthase [Candidatus Bathyarchaeota archaeon]
MIVMEILKSLYYILPAYCANGAPVIFGGGKPLDFGKKFLDGKPIFGSHKTIRGFISGLAIGTFVGLIQWVFGASVGYLKVDVPLGFALSLGAMTGDLLGSFIKRRLNLKPGASLPIIDQMSFVVVALAFGYLIEPPTPTEVIIILLLTGLLHLLTNKIAYHLRIKRTPW